MSRSSRFEAIFLIGLLLLAVVLFGKPIAPLGEADSLAYVELATSVSHGKFFEFNDPLNVPREFYSFPPGYSLVLGAALLFTDSIQSAAHFSNLLAVSITLLALCLAFWQERIKYFLPLIFVAWLVTDSFHSQILTEFLALCLCITYCALCWRTWLTRSGNYFLLSTLILCLAILVRPALLCLLICHLSLAIRFWKGDERKNLIYLFLGLLLPLLIFPTLNFVRFGYFKTSLWKGAQFFQLTSTLADVKLDNSNPLNNYSWINGVLENLKRVENESIWISDAELVERFEASTYNLFRVIKPTLKEKKMSWLQAEPGLQEYSREVLKRRPLEFVRLCLGQMLFQLKANLCLLSALIIILIIAFKAKVKSFPLGLCLILISILHIVFVACTTALSWRYLYFSSSLLMFANLLLIADLAEKALTSERLIGKND